ncbi:MAG: hypothetical protein F6K42_03615, partial [Leptolyngbya sp. SIO1D8]|nr:hypothetical protein [Leptolyngbya sp. SIO1D8]
MGWNCSGKSTIGRWLQRCLRGFLVLAVVLLTGCLEYDLDIQFDSQTHGQWIQQLR